MKYEVIQPYNTAGKIILIIRFLKRRLGHRFWTRW